jgi:hypothetical protein
MSDAEAAAVTDHPGKCYSLFPEELQTVLEPNSQESVAIARKATEAMALSDASDPGLREFLEEFEPWGDDGC